MKDKDNNNDEELKKDEKPEKPEDKDKDNSADRQEDPYAYEDGEFNPDEWDEQHPIRKRTRVMQKGLGIVVSIVALILFALLFVVEFRSYTKVKKNDNTYVSTDNKEVKEDVTTSILNIIETGSNYTIYLDSETGIEYVMFKVGSSISIQPLINPDGSYKQYVEPTTPAGGAASEATTKHSWIDGFKKQPEKEQTTQSTATVGASLPAAVHNRSVTAPSYSSASATQAAQGETEPATAPADRAAVQ